MVTEYGMSAKLGAVKYGTGDDEPFLGRTYGSTPELLARDGGRDRRRDPRADRGRAHRGVGGAQREPRHPRRAGARAAGEGDAGPQRPGPHLRSRGEAAEDHLVRRVRLADPVRPAADQDARGARARARRGVARRRPRRSRGRCRRPNEGGYILPPGEPSQVGAGVNGHGWNGNGSGPANGHGGPHGYGQVPTGSGPYQNGQHAGYPQNTQHPQPVPAPQPGQPGQYGVPGPFPTPPNWTGGVVSGPLGPLPQRGPGATGGDQYGQGRPNLSKDPQQPQGHRRSAVRSVARRPADRRRRSRGRRRGIDRDRPGPTGPRSPATGWPRLCRSTRPGPRPRSGSC